MKMLFLRVCLFAAYGSCFENMLLPEGALSAVSVHGGVRTPVSFGIAHGALTRLRSRAAREATALIPEAASSRSPRRS